MSSTLFTMLLAGSSIIQFGHATYGAYGSYGTYGCIGDECRVFGILMPYYYVQPYRYYQYHYQQNPAAAPKKEQEAFDSRMQEMKKLLATYEEKVRDLEQKLGDVHSSKSLHEERLRYLESSQTTLMEILDKNQTKLVASIEDKLKQGIVQLDDRLRVMEEKVGGKGGDAVASLTMGNLGVSLEQRLAKIEQLLQAKTQEAVPAQTTHNVTNNTTNNDPAWLEFLRQQSAAKLPPGPGQQPLTSGLALNRGLIIVSLPSDAKLFLDGMPSAVGSNLRSFITPDLEQGKNYFYTIRAEVIRGGKVLTETQRVYFQPGREVRVSFDHLDTIIPNSAPVVSTTND